MRPSPEEQARLKAEKEAKKAAKKAKFGDANADQNMAVVEVIIPWTTSWRESDGKFYTKEIDAEKPPWDSMSREAEHSHRFNIWLHSGIWPTMPMKLRLIRTDSLQEAGLRRLYGDHITFQTKRS